MSRIQLSIDRLALGGFEPAERRAFEQGLRAELARTLADPATLAQIHSRSSNVRSIPTLRLGKVVLQPGISGARNLGRAVARAVGASGSLRMSGNRGANERRPHG